jgi:hypothetical protein
MLMSSAAAEYRVYQYMISPRLTERSPASFVVTSTLDPTSYVSYHGGSGAIRVNLLKTWSCMGHTGGKELCPEPLKQAMNELVERD